ncbi:MAG: hypothetical protein JJU07_02345 [Natronohydrobacter sp.]|nr:hypothetical protein [Natronohydrobacter sp.]
MIARTEHHDLLPGLVRLHILHHAVQYLAFGQCMIDALAGHSYRLSPKGLNPMPVMMERDGLAVARVRELKGEAGTE